MIQPQTVLDIIDNTGGQKGQCIKVLNKTKSPKGLIGDLILISIKKVKTKSKMRKIKKKELHKAIIIQTKKKKNRYDGSSIKFHKNSIVLIKDDNKKYQILGNRILGMVPNEFRSNDDNLKVISLSSKTI